jgi:anti-sigma factor RsiW
LSTDDLAIEIELHGYLDGALDPIRAAEVEAYLNDDRAAAERLVHYGIQGDLVRRLYGSLLTRPTPTAMISALMTAAGE